MYKGMSGVEGLYQVVEIIESASIKGSSHSIGNGTKNLSTGHLERLNSNCTQSNFTDDDSDTFHVFNVKSITLTPSKLFVIFN